MLYPEKEMLENVFNNTYIMIMIMIMMMAIIMYLS